MLDVSIAVLAAGKGSRLKLPYPKVLAPILGQPMLKYVLDSIGEFTQQNNLKAQVGVVTGHQSNLVNEYLASEKFSFPLKTAFQKDQLGTADAVKSYIEQIDQAKTTPLTMIVCGDTPLLTADIFKKMWIALKNNQSLSAVACTFIASNPRGYGRIIKHGQEQGFSIKEEKDANTEEKKIHEVNAALYLVKTSHITNFLKNLSNNNAAKEYYLTDLFKEQFAAEAICFSEEQDFLGVNDQDQLESVTKILIKRKIANLRSAGVHILDSTNLYLDWTVQVEEGTTILPGCFLKGKTIIGKNASVGPYAVLKNTQVMDHTNIHPFTVAEDAIIGAQSEIGPLCRLRPGTNLGEKVKIGNFVEIKKSALAKGVKVSHLSYVGDASIGENANIGCGFITCNYDGKNKHQTIIGARTFIGSDCQTIAPVSIGSDCFVAAGSTINEKMPNGSFAIARSKQTTKEDMAKRFLKSTEGDKVNT